MNYADNTVPGEFIVRGSWGNIIADVVTGKVLRINDKDGEEYDDIVRFDPTTLRPCVTSDGQEHNETDILHTTYFIRKADGRELRVDELKEEAFDHPEEKDA